MQLFLTGPGFLGTRATFHSDLSLLLILISALLLTVGWRLAARRSYKIHCRIQTSAVILNTIAVLAVMIPSFLIYILPGIPGKLLEGTYGITGVHAFIGALGLVLGVFVVLRANGLVPPGLRFENYKLFMRTSYAIYMLATLIGVIIYIVVFMVPA